MSVQPTVGRIVHFYSDTIANRDPHRPGCGLNGQGAGPYVAIVTQVFDGPYVNLKVLGWGVDAWDEGSVSAKPPQVGLGNDRSWEWPQR